MIEVLNKKCPCPAVCELQAKVAELEECLTIVLKLVETVKQLREELDTHGEYFSNDSRSIKDLDKRMAVVEVQVEGIDKKVDRIDENVQRLLERWMDRG